MRRIYATLTFIFVLSLPSSAQWERLGFPQGTPRTILTTAQGLYAASDRAICLSHDNAQTWDSLSSVYISPMTLIQAGDILLSASSFMRAGLPLTPVACVFRSEDSGRSWDSVLAAVYGASLLTKCGSTLYANPDGKLFSSADTGRTWTAVAGASVIPDVINDIFTEGSTLYLHVQDNRLYRSTDGGATWDSLTAGIPPTFYAVLAHDSSLYVGSFNGKGFFASHTRGDSWKTLNAGLPDSAGFWHLLLVDNYLLAVVQHAFRTSTVYRLDLRDTTWERFDTGLDIQPYKLVHDLTANDKFVFLATDGAVWRRRLSDLVTAIERPSEPAPRAFTLSQNYPNPFNPSTTIPYALPQRSHVTLTVFNMLGEQVGTLVNGEMEAGNHSIRFDASNLASGVYFYRIQAAGFTETKRLVILK